MRIFRALVTGGNGFLGRAVVRAFRHAGVDPIVYPSSHYDLRDPKECKQAILRANAARVIHLAAKVGGIGANQDSPGAFFHDNILMGVNVIEQSRAVGIDKVVLVGTVCSYPSVTPVPFSEKNLWEGYPEPTNAPYGIAKKALGVMLDAYHRQYGLKSAYLIPANLYGPGDNFGYGSHVIPALIVKFYEATRDGLPAVTLWGDGTPTREFLYVEDAAEAIVQAANRIDNPEPINVGSGQSMSIAELADMIAKTFNYQGKIQFQMDKPNGQMSREIDSTRAHDLLKWRPKVLFTSGLAATIRYYREVIAK